MELGDDQAYGRAIFHNGKVYGIRGRKGSPLSHNQTLQVIDFKSKKIEKILPLSDNPYSLIFVEDKLYVTHFNDGTPSQPDHRVSIIDPQTYQIEDVLEVGKGPSGICYSKSLGKVYTANFWDNSVSVIDVKTRKVIKTIPTNQKLTEVVRCTD
jgi:YVTN family beta-propeller protein